MTGRWISLDVCTDCLMVLANGVSDDHGERAAAGMETVWGDDQPGLVAACVDDGCDCSETGDGWFSWQSCDGCGSVLGGDRSHAAFDSEWKGQA